MSDGAARDKSKDEAWAQSRNCPHCSGEGLAEVFDPSFDGRRSVVRECIVRGEVKRVLYPQVIAAHCLCPMGRWIRVKAEPQILDRIPDLADVLAGRSRYQAADPTGDVPGAWFQAQPGGGGAVRVKGGMPV